MKALAALLALWVPAVAGAQTLEPPGAIGQIGPPAPAADDTRSSQIGAPSRNVRTPLPAPPSAAPAPQLGMTHDAQAPVQLVRERPTGRGSAQLSHGPPSAQPPAPLSGPADGRTAAVAKVSGEDRCDPARPQGTAACRAVIETRSAEFPPPAPTPLSPEQRLLVEQRPIAPQGLPGDAIARTASRGTTRAGVDADAPTMQGLASIYLGAMATPPAKAVDPTAGLTADQAAAATALLGALNGARP